MRFTIPTSPRCVFPPYPPLLNMNCTFYILMYWILLLFKKETCKPRALPVHFFFLLSVWNANWNFRVTAADLHRADREPAPSDLPLLYSNQ